MDTELCAFRNGGLEWLLLNEILSKDSRTPVRPPDASQCWGYRTQAGTMFHILTLHKKLVLRTLPECCRKCGKPERLIKLSE